MQDLADKISNIFVPLVIFIAILTFLVWWISGASFTFAMLRLVAVLLISCPCAMGLATPLAVMVGMGRGAEQGILFKSSEAMQRLGTVGHFVFDKTGTITQGKLALTDIISNLDATANQGLTDDDAKDGLPPWQGLAPSVHFQDQTVLDHQAFLQIRNDTSGLILPIH